MVEDLMKETGIDPQFIGYNRLAIFSTPIEYFFGERQREWHFPFGVSQEELDKKVFDPVYNRIYPLPEFDIEINQINNIRLLAEQIHPLTLVQIRPEETIYLALKGGGQDFTWNIARAYLWCGYLPPLWCSRLPMFPGTDIRNPLEKIVVLGLAASFRHATERIATEDNIFRRVFTSNLEEFDKHGRDTDQG